MFVTWLIWLALGYWSWKLEKAGFKYAVPLAKAMLLVFACTMWWSMVNGLQNYTLMTRAYQGLLLVWAVVLGLLQLRARKQRAPSQPTAPQ